MHVVKVIDVCEVSDADCGLAIPFEHGVDGLGELRAALLVDATCVYPPPVVSEAGRELTEFDDFGAQSTLEIW